MMSNIFSTQRLNFFSGICGNFGIKRVLYGFGVYNIDFSYLDNHLPKPDYIFYCEPWYNRYRCYAMIDETNNHPDTTLISEAPEFFIMDMDYICARTISLNVIFGRYTFPYIVYSYTPLVSIDIFGSRYDITKMSNLTSSPSSS